MKSFKLIVLASFAFSVSMSHAGKKTDLPWQKQPAPRPPVEKKPENTLNQIPDDCSDMLGDAAYRLLAKEMAQLERNQKVRDELQRAGLSITTVSWQDTGRHHGSSGGNNISDVRLAAITKDREGKIETYTQPIIRLPNFEDKTVDIDMNKIFIPVGNAWGLKQPIAVSLKDVLSDISTFTTSHEVIKGSERVAGSLYLPERDSQVLVSAQAAIMPVPKNGEAHFVPSIFNYQSTEAHPAVMVILVSNRGTSITVIDNKRDSLSGGEGMWGSSGQMLFHNKNGEKAPFTLQSLKEVSATEQGKAKIDELNQSGQAIAGQSGVNQVMMIQVPLKYPPSRFRGGFQLLGATLEMASAGGTRGLDTGVVDVANYTLGKFIEFDGKGAKLERDPNVPIRIDVVRYMASDTTDLTLNEVQMLPEELRGIYEAGSNLGSLVTGDDYTRITRNHRPWTLPWWKIIVVPYLPRPYIDPNIYFGKMFGPNWMFRFATEELAQKTVSELEKPKPPRRAKPKK